MAQSTTTIESVWAAKGNLPDNAIVATADGKYPALDGSLITNVGAGDLLAANNLSELTATASVARTNLELGAADTVEFGGFIPPAGTTAEIDAVTTATVGQVMIDTDKNRALRFTGAASYAYTGAIVQEFTYFVDPTFGSDASGRRGNGLFQTINGALTQAIADGDSVIVINCLAGIYTDQDVFSGLSSTATISIIFEEGCFYDGSSQTSPLFDNSVADLNIQSIVGGLVVVVNSQEIWKGPFDGNGTIIGILGVANWSATSLLFNVTGGTGSISVARKMISILTKSTVVEISGSADVTLSGIYAEHLIAAFQPQVLFATLRDTATLRMINFKGSGYGSCEITTDTACKLILENTVTGNGAGLGTTTRSVVAPAASTNPTAYAFGQSSSEVAASNITINTDLGSFTVSTTANEVL